MVEDGMNEMKGARGKGTQHRGPVRLAETWLKLVEKYCSD